MMEMQQREYARKFFNKSKYKRLIETVMSAGSTCARCDCMHPVVIKTLGDKLC